MSSPLPYRASRSNDTNPNQPPSQTLSQSPSSSPSPPDEETEHPTGPDLPLSMSTSLLLATQLPADTTTALTTLHETLDPPTLKLNVRFQAIGSAPILKQKVFKISASSKFAAVVTFLRKKLGVGKEESLFCYINNVFAPGLDEGVGNLWRCFKTDDQLIVSYSKVPAFG